MDIIEAGFPIASAGDAEAVRRIATEVEGPVIAALARCVEKDISVAWEAVSRSVRPRIHTFLATSDIHLAFKLKIGRDEALRQARRWSLMRVRCAPTWSSRRRTQPART